jgi:chromate reductase
MKIIALCGSLRANSFNRMLLHLAQEVAPRTMHVVEAGWSSLPAFNADVLGAGFPDAAENLSAQIAAADGVLIVSPEYNFSVPGMFKNALDWVSRHPTQPFASKPVAILSAATGQLGGARMQYDLRRILLYLNAMVLAKPEVFVGFAAEKFGEDGRCRDPKTREFVAALMQAFEAWVVSIGRQREQERTN